MNKYLVNKKYEIEAKDLDDAELWLLNNHPEEYYSGTITQVNGCDFMIIAVEEYYHRVFGTTDNNVIYKRLRDGIVNRPKLEEYNYEEYIYGGEYSEQ